MDKKDTRSNLPSTNINIAQKNRISYQEYLRREYNIVHAPYQNEMNFYDVIASGDVENTRELCKEAFHEKDGLGTLSENQLRNFKYHFVISAAMVARTCIQYGMAYTQAYDMSDYYIQEADKQQQILALTLLHDEMCIEYASKMHQIRKQVVTSKPISKCIDYIYDHLHTRIRMDDLARITDLSEAYISRLFKAETGYTVSGYILSKKLETAARMLRYSDYSIAQISAIFDFPSQSYFSKVFKEVYGVPPIKYRAGS